MDIKAEARCSCFGQPSSYSRIVSADLMNFMPTRVRMLILFVLTGFCIGCSGSNTPSIERPMEEVEAELAPADEGSS